MVKNTLIQKNIVLVLLVLLSCSSIALFTASNISTSNKVKSNQKTIENLSLLNSEYKNQLKNSPIKENLLNSISTSFFTKNIGQLGTHEISLYYKTNGLQINFLPSQIQFLEQKGQKIIHFSLLFPGSNVVYPIGLNQLERVNNYFLGKETFSNVPLFKEVLYRNIYNGIDLIYFFTGQGLKYDFIIHPGADSNQIAVKTSSSTEVLSSGSTLQIIDTFTSRNLLQDQNLLVYQQIDSQIIKVPGSFSVQANSKNTFTYSVGSHNTNYNVIIDPILVVNSSTYLGGSGADSAVDIVRDNQNNFYVTGTTDSNNFLTLNAINGTNSGSTDIFIMKLNSTGTGILWSTYFGGNGDDFVSKIGLDINSNVIVTGYSKSTNLPLKNSQNTALNGTEDALVVSLTNNGQSLNFCSLIGGTSSQKAYGLFVSPTSTEYYIAGITNSANFKTTSNAYNTLFGGLNEGFLLKMNSQGTILYSSFIGLNNSESDDVFVDTTGIYLTGSTTSNLSSSINAGFTDTYVIKLSVDGTSVLYSRLIGGNLSDLPTSLTVNHQNVYVTGRTFSDNFPVNTTIGIPLISQNMFVVKLTQTGSISFSTVINENNYIYPTKIAVDSRNQTIIAGYTYANNSILRDELKNSLTGASDGFITIFNPQGTNITYSTYIGGSDIDQINSFVVEPNYNIYLVGETHSMNYPVFDAIQNKLKTIGSSDAFFTHLSLDYTTPKLEIEPNFSYTFNTTGHNLTFTASDNDPYATYTVFKAGTSIATGYLTGQPVNISVDNLPIGNYNYTVLAQDRTGHKIAKTTIITVTNANNSSGLTSNAFLAEFLAVMGVIVVGGTGLTFIGLKLNKKRQAKRFEEKNTLKNKNPDPAKTADLKSEQKGEKAKHKENSLSDTSRDNNLDNLS